MYFHLDDRELKNIGFLDKDHVLHYLIAALKR